jgi:hypothetical protein
MHLFVLRLSGLYLQEGKLQTSIPNRDKFERYACVENGAAIV